MRSFLFAALGTVVGAIAGMVLGIAFSLAYVELAGVSCFEGYCGYLVFLTFAPIRLLVGAVTGAVVAYRWSRRA